MVYVINFVIWLQFDLENLKAMAQFQNGFLTFETAAEISTNLNLAPKPDLCGGRDGVPGEPGDHGRRGGGVELP